MTREHKPGFYEVFLEDLASFDVVDMAAKAIGRPLTPVVSILALRSRDEMSAWLSPWFSDEDALDEAQFGPSVEDDEYHAPGPTDPMRHLTPL